MVQVFKLTRSRIKPSNRCSICLILLLSLQLNCFCEKQPQTATVSNTTAAAGTGLHQKLVSPPVSSSSNTLDSPKNRTTSPSTRRRPTRRRAVHERKRRIKPREESKTPSPFELAVSDELLKDANIDSLSNQYGDDEYLDDTILDTFEDPPATPLNQNKVRFQEQRKENEIENIVRSQIEFGASNWVTLKPEMYPQGPSFNESIQGLDWPSYLANYSKAYSESATSRAGVSGGRDLFYPNHNYKFDNNYTSPFRQYVSKNALNSVNSYLATSDSVTASSEESNRYDQLPSATESHLGTIIASTPEPTAHTTINQTAAFTPIHYRYQIRNLPPKPAKNATGRPRWYNPNLDLTRLIFRNYSANISESLKQEPYAKPETPDSSKFRISDTSVSANNEQRNNYILHNKQQTEDSHIDTRTPILVPNITTGNGAAPEDLDKGYQLRPTIIAGGPQQPPWLLRNHFSTQTSESFATDNQTIHQPKPPDHLQQSPGAPHEDLNISPAPPIGSPSGTPYVRPFGKLLWDSSSDYSNEPSRPSSAPSLQRVTTVIVPTMRAQTFTPAPPQFLSSTSTEPVVNLVKSNSAASMKAIGARLGRRPSHHHHHHSHVHSIRPALISLPGRPKFRDYEGLVAAAAAAAAVTAAAAAATNNQQPATNHRLRQQMLASRPLFPGMDGHSLPSTYSYRLNIGTPAAHIRPIFVRHPPVSIPIGGTLSTMNGLRQNKPPLRTIQATMSATYHRSLLGHILDSANRAVKQVAGNTAGLLNLHPPPALADTLFQGGRVYSAKNNRDTNPGIRDLFESSRGAEVSFAAPPNLVDSSSYLSPLESDGKELTPIGLKVGSHPTIPLKPLSPRNPLQEATSDYGNLKEQVIFAPLSDEGNLLYPILSSQLDPNPVASLIEEPDDDSFSPLGQTSSYKYYQAPLWATEPETTNKRIPLNKHYNRSSSSSLMSQMPRYSKQVYPHNRGRRPTQTILVEENRGVHTNNSYLANLDEQPPMRYAVAHYIGETDSMMDSTQKGPSAQSGKKLVYEIVDDSKLSNQDGQAPTIDFIPIKDSEASQSSLKLNKVPHKSEPLGQVYANLNGQTFVLSNVDKQAVLSGGAPLEVASAQYPQESAAAIIADASMDDYRHGSGGSKPQEHLIQFTTTGSLYPHTDPLHVAIQAAASSIKPHLTAASDLINYHKLRLINHYLQYHMNDGMSDYGPPSNSARLASSGGPRAHLLLHYWPIVLALLPIMIIVSIMVQLVLAAPLVLFAMTTLTAARFVGAIFGPLFGREDLAHGDLIGAATKSATEPFPGTLQQTNLHSNNITSSSGGSARINNSNFIQSIIKLHNNANFGPTKVSKAVRAPKATDGSTNGAKTSSQRRRRKKRHLQQDHHQQQQVPFSSFFRELEEYMDSFEFARG